MKKASIFVIENNLVIGSEIASCISNYPNAEISVKSFESVSQAIENKLFQPDIVFINHNIFEKVSCKQIDTLNTLIKDVRIVTISGESDTNLFTKALRNGVDYYIPSGQSYLSKVENYLNCYFTNTIPDKTTLLKQWYFELAKEED